jgi:membrane protein implicated in regulation of membrane protease activity
VTPVVAWILVGVLLFTLGMAFGALPAVWASLAALLTAAASMGLQEPWAQSVFFVIAWVVVGILTRRFSRPVTSSSPEGDELRGRSSMKYHKLTVEDLQVKGKRVFVRVDFNVPRTRTSRSPTTPASGNPSRPSNTFRARALR